ncbi:MAG: intradiol ring-cleavage dioxygenase [Phycisphaerae bacterium]|nr:intradiol ring-cleavage dioxygenase [Phycisphaerae bacterium]
MRTHPSTSPAVQSTCAFLAAAMLLAACELRRAEPTALQAPDGPPGAVGMPANPPSIDTSPGWNEPGRRIILTGVIYGPDGRTPAPGVTLYYYHTDPSGLYRHRPDIPRSMPPNALGQTHGYLRGWVRTGADGRYEIRTIRPGPYPGSDEPAHIHATITEPGLTEYYIDDFVFDDDPLLTTARRTRVELRAGGGVVRPVRTDGPPVAQRDIVLGLNVPGHPRRPAPPASGRGIGADVVSFSPFHAWGPERGTRTCPICAHGWRQGALLFVGRRPDWDSVRAWLRFFEDHSAQRPDHFRAFLVYGNPDGYDPDRRRAELEALGRELNLSHVALTFLPSLTDEPSDLSLNRLDPEATTLIVYRRRRIIACETNPRPTPARLAEISELLRATADRYLDLPPESP